MIVDVFSSLYIFSVVILSEYGWGAKYARLVAIGFVGFLLLERLLTRKPLIEFRVQHVCYVLFLMVAIVSGLVLGSIKPTIKTGGTAIQVFLVSLSLFMVIIDRRSLTCVGWTLIISSICSNVFVRFGILPLPMGADISRFGGTLKNANLFAFVSLLGVMFVVYLWKVHKHTLIRAGLVGAGALLVHQILLSGSRKGIIGISAVFLIQYILYAWANISRQLFKGPILGIVALTLFFSGFTYVVMQSKHSHRIRNLVHFMQDEELEKGETSIRRRADLIQIGLDHFLEHPFIGTGMASFKKIKLENTVWSETGGYSHSNYIEVLCSSGIIGFLLYYSIYLTMAFKLYGIRTIDRHAHFDPIFQFAAIAVPILMFYEMFAVTYYGKTFWIFLSAILGCLTILERANTTPQHSGTVSP